MKTNSNTFSARIIAVILAIALVFSLSACTVPIIGKDSKSPPPSSTVSHKHDRSNTPTPAPTPAPTPTPAPVPAAASTPAPAAAQSLSADEIMKLFSDSIQAPRTPNLLDEPVVMYVRTRYGNYAYAQKKPLSDSKAVYNIDEGTKVIVYAIEDGYGLALVENSLNVGGWINYDLLSFDSREGKPGPDDLEGLPTEVFKPQRDHFLEEYMYMYIKTKYGVRAEILNDPMAKEDQLILGYAYEGEQVTVIAEMNGVAFIRTGDGTRGWLSSTLLVSEYN